MDSIDFPSANLPARLPDASSRQPAQVHVASRELTTAAAPTAVDSRLLVRSLVRNWWKILLAWVVLAAPLTYLVYRNVQPMYQAYALIKVESNQPELFDHSLMAREGAGPSYLQTEIETIRANSVLDLVLSHAEIKSSPMFRDSLDPKAELRKKLVLEIVPNTNFIRIALESQDNKEATDIVNAVVDAYREISADTGTTYTKMTASKDLMKILIADLKEYKKGLSKKIEETRDKLRDLARKGNVEFSKPDLSVSKNDENGQGVQPSLNRESLEQYRTTKDHLMQCEFEILELEARYSAKQAEEQQAHGVGRQLPAPRRRRAP